MAVAIFVPFRTSPPEPDAGPVVEPLALAVDAPLLPRWPELVEPSATACDANARLDLVDALASIASPWALDVLDRASGDETDPAVRAAIVSALAQTPKRSLVT